MSNTVANPSPLDPTADCQPDEPYFPLVGHDPDAPATIRFWADTRRKRVMSLLIDLPPGIATPKELREDLIRCTEADFIAVDMERWRKGLPKDEEVIRGQRLMHGVESLPDGDQVRVREVLADAVTSLRESAFHASAANSAFETLDEVEEEDVAALKAAIATINQIASKNALRRPAPDDFKYKKDTENA